MPKDDPLASRPFSYRRTKDGTVRISQQGRVVKILRGRDAERFLHRIESADEEAAQLLMARVTGQFKFGNERMGKLRDKRR